MDNQARPGLSAQVEASPGGVRPGDTGNGVAVPVPARVMLRWRGPRGERAVYRADGSFWVSWGATIADPYTRIVEVSTGPEAQSWVDSQKGWRRITPVVRFGNGS